ncbi:MAG: lytic murein transglycosylase B [Gammaproteobacteria bacterium]|jgi:membrane-bound lytic murein transglycosylase B|nr:lytic murein transglycosylase B [Gammaproteobacteria bacterium]
MKHAQGAIRTRSLWTVLFTLAALTACVAPPKKNTSTSQSSATAATTHGGASAGAQANSAASSSAGTTSGDTTNPAVPAAPTPFDLEREDIRSFIAETSKKHGIAESEIRALLSQGMFQPRIIAAITRPAETVLRWWEYSNRLVTPERVARGVEFSKEHRARLDAAHDKTGVSPAYIVAIIGIETNYGRNKGSWRVLDALMTLGFDYPPRGRFFRSELEQFLLLVREESLDPLTTLGSYAGAMGAPQFMPSSYRRFAVNGPLDGATDSRRDLFVQWDDVISSVANYFSVHGWERDAPVLLEGTASTETLATVMPTLERRNLDLNQTAGGARTLGFTLPESIADATPVILVPAELADRPNVRVGLRNFHVITRYNRSILYAMAIHDLAKAIETELARLPAPEGVATAGGSPP